MLTRELAIEILVADISEQLGKDNLSDKEKKSLVLTSNAITNILSTKVSILADARLQMEGFAAYMAADNEEAYLESYFTENMKRYVDFIEAAQTRFDIILNSVNDTINKKPQLLSRYKFTYDSAYSFWIEEDEIKIHSAPSITAKTRFCIEKSLPIYVEIFEKDVIVFSNTISNLNDFINKN